MLAWQLMSKSAWFQSPNLIQEYDDLLLYHVDPMDSLSCQILSLENILWMHPSGLPLTTQRTCVAFAISGDRNLLHLCSSLCKGKGLIPMEPFGWNLSSVYSRPIEFSGNTAQELRFEGRPNSKKAYSSGSTYESKEGMTIVRVFS